MAGSERSEGPVVSSRNPGHRCALTRPPFSRSQNRFLHPKEAKAMYVSRFFAALTLVVAVAVAGVAIEQRSLRYRQAISLDQHRLEVLDEEFARLRLEVSRLGAPTRILAQLRQGAWSLEEPERPEVKAHQGQDLAEEDR